MLSWRDRPSKPIHDSSSSIHPWKAPVGGIEPPIVGLTGRCLTVWPHRIKSVGATGFEPATSASRMCDDGADTPEKQAPNDADVAVCTRVCTNCCRALTIADKATSDALMSMAAALQELTAEKDCHQSGKSRPNSNSKQAGSALLETIRLLAKLSPDERSALIGPLKALG